MIHSSIVFFIWIFTLQVCSAGDRPFQACRAQDVIGTFTAKDLYVPKGVDTSKYGIKNLHQVYDFRKDRTAFNTMRIFETGRPPYTQDEINTIREAKHVLKYSFTPEQPGTIVLEKSPTDFVDVFRCDVAVKEGQSDFFKEYIKKGDLLFSFYDGSTLIGVMLLEEWENK